MAVNVALTRSRLYGSRGISGGEILSMSPEMVRHYSKRARTLKVARGAADRMTGGRLFQLANSRPKGA